MKGDNETVIENVYSVNHNNSFKGVGRFMNIHNKIYFNFILIEKIYMYIGQSLSQLITCIKHPQCNKKKT